MATRIRFALVVALLPLLALGAQPVLAEDEGTPPTPPASEVEVFPAPAPVDIALIVFGGGSTDDVVAVTPCASGRPARLWTYVDGTALFYVPDPDAASRGPWTTAFGSGIPAFTPIGVDCR